jgi:hypothetical protein
MTLFPMSLGCYLVSVYHPRYRGNPQGIDWAAHAPAATIQNMGVDHGGPDIFMTEQLLNRPEIISVLQEVGCEGLLEDGRWQPRTERYAGGVSEWGRADAFANCSPESGLESYPLSIPSGHLRRSGRKGQRIGDYSCPSRPVKPDGSVTGVA